MNNNLNTNIYKAMTDQIENIKVDEEYQIKKIKFK